MRRLRLALIVLLVALSIPLALLVGRALRSAALEERVRHDAVAERIFDEMERALSDLLAREEERGPEEYRFYRRAGEAASGASGGERSPLSYPSTEPFVIAHFQIGPDGRLRSPRRPGDPVDATRRGDWPPADDERAGLDRALALLEREVAPFFQRARADAERPRRLLPAASPAPSPALRAQRQGDREEEEDVEDARGTDLQRALEKSAAATASGREGRDEAGAPLDDGVAATTASPEPEPAADQPASAYEVLKSLNVGAKQRAERKQVVLEAPRAPSAPPSTLADSEPPRRSEEEIVLSEARPGAAERAAPSERAAPARSALRAGTASDEAGNLDELADRVGGSGMASSDEDARPAREPYSAARPAAAPERPARRTGRVVLEPMAGHPLGDAYLVLHRTVLVDGVGYRQGLLLDRAALGRWLSEQVIGSGPLAELATIRFTAPAPGEPDLPGHRAAHTFAEPFSGLSAVLFVGPLAGSSGTATILGLAVGLLIVALVGAFAVYRAAAVVVEFAERRGNFVAAVSHELKTPLTAIRMHGEMLRDGVVASEDKRDDYYRTISEESERLSRLIDNVLEFSLLEKGQRKLSTIVGSPASVVADVVERLRPHAERQGFALVAEIDDALPAVRFDRDALAQMLFNLIDNAIKYAGGAPRKQIVVRCESIGDGRVAVSVRDFGPGVPREQLARIFEPFHRVEQELTRSTRGSGIGLSLVKQLGEAMGAAVRGERPEGGGLRVRVELAAGTA